MLRRFVSILIVTAAFVLSACVSTGSGNASLVWRLNNRGPVALSTENPFLAANLFVSTIAEQSPVVYGFMKFRGVPPAVEVKSGYFSKPQTILYYPESREFFTLEQLVDSWIVHGPERMEPSLAKSVAVMTRNTLGSPVLRVHSRPELRKKSYNTYDSETALPDEALLTGQERAGFGKEGFQSADGHTDNISRDPEHTIRQQVQDLQASSENSGAEISPRGDLVHYVTFPGETLSIIARWYTHDRANAGRLARINELKNPNHLEVGDSVVIPSYLLRTKSPYNAQELQELQRLIRHQ